MINQPELGSEINKLRIEKGITQKELADACQIDIRTVQRITSGEVKPRMSTLKLMSEFLQHDFKFQLNPKQTDKRLLRSLLIIALISGVVHLISYLIIVPLFPQFYTKVNEVVLFGSSILYLLTGTIFYYGIYSYAKSNKNTVLQIGVVISILLMLSFGVLGFLSGSNLSFINPLKHVLTIVLGVNCIVFGIGLLRHKSQKAYLYRLAGILQLIASPFFILPVSILHYIGMWLAVPFILLLLSIVYFEYRSIPAQESVISL